MEQVYSVSQINGYIKNMFLKDYVLSHIYMKGEVSNCKYHTSGHIYFTLKDEGGQMACVMFAGQRTGLSFRLEEGQSIIVFGSISVYERDGKYQMYAKEIRLDGIGLLYEQFEQLKHRLRAEGLFDKDRKKQIPEFPSVIGIITAPTGAAIRDMVTIAKRRNPYIQLILCPAKVQGADAAKTVVRGIKRLDKLGVDTIIIGRGGGSMEDLWAFNEEIVARAIFACNTPVISAVGHETDTTIADFAADLRAPTPSAAAELAVNDVSLLLAGLVDCHHALAAGLLRRIALAKNRAGEYRLRLSYVSPGYQIAQRRQQASGMEDELRRLMRDALLRQRHRVALFAQALKGLSPLDKLSQGYSYVSGEDGTVINSVYKVRVGEPLFIDVTDGRITAVATAVEEQQERME